MVFTALHAGSLSQRACPHCQTRQRPLRDLPAQPRLQPVRADRDAAELAMNEENVKRLLKRDRRELQAAGPGFAAEWDKPSDRGAWAQKQEEQPSSSEATASSSSGAAADSAAASSSAATSPGTPRQFGARPPAQLSPFDSVLSPEQAAKPARKASPFAASQGSSNPFGAGDADSLWRNSEAEWMPEDDLKWYQSFSKEQLILGLSFVLVILLMFGTFLLVVKVGAVSLNFD